MKTYSALEVCRLTGIHHQTLWRVTRDGLLSPSRVPGHARAGYMWSYSEKDLERVRLIVALGSLKELAAVFAAIEAAAA